MRQFETGANRDADETKIDYEGHISPLAIEAFGEYMHKHRFLKDGTVRASDNWQKLFGEQHISVCMKSLWRHFLEAWKIHRGHGDKSNFEDALCGIMFNTQAIIHKLRKDRERL